MLKTAICLLVLVPFATANAQVYQCTSPDGGKILQQTQCSGGKKLRDASPAIVDSEANDFDHSGARLSSTATSRQLVDATRKLDIQIAIQERRPMIGMTEQQLVAAIGQAGKINASENARGTSKQWIYYGQSAGDTRYVYTDGGDVTSMQWSFAGSTGPANVGPNGRSGR